MVIEDIIKTLKSPSEKPPEDLAKQLLCYKEAKKTSKEVSLWQFGLIQEKNLLEKIDRIKKDTMVEENAVRRVASEYIKNSRKAKTHTQQKENLESALKLLINLFERKKEDLQPPTLTLIAKAYLFRSRIIRPKGKTIPLKKKEALKKGIEFAKMATKKDISDANERLEAYRTHAQLWLELEKVDKKEVEEELKKVLEDALENGCKKLKEKRDIQIAIRYSELNKSNQYLDGIIQFPLEEGIALEKAKAYKLLKCEDKIKESMQVVLEQLGNLGFSHPLWEETVEFIKGLKKDKMECWEKLSSDLYKVCQEREKDTATLHLRWYWSRLRDLYDLAFLAASTTEEKATIADSLKSRPALRWSVWEELGKKDSRYKDILEAESIALLGGYIPGRRGIILKPDEKVKQKIEESLNVTDIPQGWIAIYFYLVQIEGEEKGYALIYNKKEDTWREKEISSSELKDLFNTYLTWQANYNRYQDGAAKSLVELCKKIGEVMPFLFDGSIPEGSEREPTPVLFVPHDFLHRLPLHGAINNKEVFLEKHPSCYLPARSLARKIEEKEPEGKILLKNFRGYDFEELFSNKIEWNIYKDPASSDDFKKISSPSRLLVLLCHGTADVVNPFNAKLKLAGDGITHLEILQSEVKLNGSSVVLGACETDLMPSLSNILDEHLSISTAFLNKGVKEILGGLWKVDLFDVEEIVKKCYDTSDTQWNIIWVWQRDKMKENHSLYKILPFRVIGVK